MQMLAVKYRLYPTPAQETVLRQMLFVCRAVYNSMVLWRKHDYEVEGKSLSYRTQQNALPVWKQAHEELSCPHSQVLQEAVKRVERAFDAYFRRMKDYNERKAKGLLREGQKPPGKPRFKGYGQYDSLTYPRQTVLRCKTTPYDCPK